MARAALQGRARVASKIWLQSGLNRDLVMVELTEAALAAVANWAEERQTWGSAHTGAPWRTACTLWAQVWR